MILFLITIIFTLFKWHSDYSQIENKIFYTRLKLENLIEQGIKNIETLNKIPVSSDYKLGKKLQDFYTNISLKNLCQDNLIIYTLNFQHGDLTDSLRYSNEAYFNIEAPKSFFPPMNNNSFLIRAFLKFDERQNIMLEKIYKAQEISGHVKIIDVVPLFSREIWY